MLLLLLGCAVHRAPAPSSADAAATPQPAPAATSPGGTQTGGLGARGAVGTWSEPPPEAATAPGAAVGGDAVILGALDKAVIDEVVRRDMSRLRYCYQRELAKLPTLSGSVTVKFVVSSTGTVSSASTGTTTLGNAEVEGCLNARFMELVFPRPAGGGIAIVKYPFEFMLH